MYEGIFMKGREFYAENDDGKKYCFCILAGHLVEDPKVEFFNNKKVSFTVKFYSKAYRNVVLWGESQASTIAETLEKGDVVFVCGTMTTSSYVIRRGEHKGETREWQDINAQIVIPMTAIEFILQMFASKEIQNILKKESVMKKSDVIESADDYDEEPIEQYEEVQEVSDSVESYDDYDSVPIPDDCPF